jgi:uncharacterized protein
MKKDDVFLTPIVNENWDEVLELIDKGFDVNGKNRVGTTAFIETIISKNATIVKFMLNIGADFQSISSKGWRPIHYAAQIGNVDMLKLLIEFGNPVDLKDKYGNTALWYACYSFKNDDESQELVEFLIKAGADPFLLNDSGKNPLFWKDKKIGLEKLFNKFSL